MLTRFRITMTAGVALAALATAAGEANAQTPRREARIEARQARRQGYAPSNMTVYAGHERAALGVTLGEDPQGLVQIHSVTPNSPADHAGLRPGDDILAINNHRMRSYRDVVQTVAEHEPNDRLTLEVGRNGRTREVDVVLAPQGAVGAAPSSYAPPPQQPNYQPAYAPPAYSQGYYNQDGYANSYYGNGYNNGNYYGPNSGYYGPNSGYYGPNSGYYGPNSGYYGPGSGYYGNGAGSSAYGYGAGYRGGYGNYGAGNFGSQVGGSLGQRVGGNVGGAIGAGVGGAIGNQGLGW